jgi:8-amino-7-oxononanoate synthase
MDDLRAMPKEPHAPPLGWLEDALQSLDDQGLRRRLVTVQNRRPGELRLAGRWLRDFTSNDYLGLSQHPALVEAARAALTLGGCGSGGSRLVTGGAPPHGSLEDAVRRFVDRDACLIFSSGYQANLGLLSALCRPGDTIFSDAHNHASIVDGCRLSGAAVRVYPHGQWETLARWLTGTDGRRWIVTETVFSMDGSLAPLDKLARVAESCGAALLVDEAHAMGVLGPGGRGLCAARGVRPEVLMGTFSKGLGSHGAFTATDLPVAHWLVNRARAFIYTTALPPPVLAASLEALAVLTSVEGDRLRRRVLTLADQLRQTLRDAGLEPTGDGTPIVSLAFADPTRAPAVQDRLQESGYLAWAFRPPTVPQGTSRLRISLSAAHDPAWVAGLGQTLPKFFREP